MADQKNVVKANTVTGDFNLVGNIIQISGMDKKAVEGLLSYFKKAFEGYLQKSAKSSETVDAIAVSQRALYEIVLRQENRQKQDKDALQEALRAEIDSAANRLSKQLEQAGGDVGLLSRNLDYTIKERLEKLSEENAKILSRLDLDKNKKRLNRAWYALRKGRFKIAENLCDSVVSDSPDCAEAYYCWALTESKIQLIWDYDEGKEQPILYDWDKAAHFGSSDYYQQALDYASDEERDRFESVAETVENVLKQLKKFEKMEREDGVTDLNCDCFICAKVSEVGGGKTKDHEYVMGGLYEALKDAGLRPFYSEVTLSQYTKGAFDYSAAILYVLSKVKCFLLVCENQDYLETPWVKNEYSWFCRYMEKNNVDWNERVLVVFDGDHPVRMPGRGKKWQDFDRAKDVEILVDRVSDIVNTRTDEEKDQEIARLMEEQARLLAENERLRNAQQSVPSELTLSPATQAASLAAEKPANPGTSKKQAASLAVEKPANPGFSKKPDATAVADKPAKVKTTDFVITNGVLKKYNGTKTDVVIPDGVTSIGNRAFEGCFGLTSITIPDGVTSIGEYAFFKCSSLTSVTIPDSVTRIRKIAFACCTKLASFTIPDSVKNIGEGAFRGCSGLTSVTIGNGVTSIGSDAFSGCNKLIEVRNLSGLNITAGNSGNGYVGYYAKHVYVNGDSYLRQTDDGYLFYDGGTEVFLVAYYGTDTALTLPNTYNGKNYAINQYAFFGCSGLTSVTIGSGVTSIGSQAFNDCFKLIEVRNLSGLNITAGSSENGCVAFDAKHVYTNGDSYLRQTDDGYLFYENGTEIYLVAYYGTDTDLILPTDYNGRDYAINQCAFSRCTGLTSVTIPNSVTSIGGYAFFNCSSLTSVTIPDGVKSIGAGAFSGCSALTSVTIRNSVTSIGEYAFCKCFNLRSITIPDNVTSIGGYAFFNCSSLTSVIIPDSVTSIGERAFTDCTGLTSVTIGNGVTSIGEWAFCGCSGLTSVTIGNSVTSIGGGAFWCCSGLTSVTIPDSVTSIGNGAFYYCTGLTSVTIGNGVTSIGEGAFEGCSSLTSVTIGNSVTSIGSGAFDKCSSLTSATIPDGVTSIGDYAFYGCRGLTEITVPEGVKTIGDEAFKWCANLKTVYCAAPAKPSGWSDKWLNDCDAKVVWESSKTLKTVQTALLDTLSETLATKASSVTEETNSDFVIKDGVLEKYNGTETDVTIPEGVKTIGEKAFAGSKLTSVNILKGVTSIGFSAFFGCSGLTSVNIPKGVTSIGESAFFGCSGLTSVTIPNSVKSIGNGAFDGCSGLTSVTIPQSVTSIGNGAFYYCTGLTSVTIGNGVTSIGERAFKDCTGLTSVTIGNGVTSIGERAFYDCSGLTSATIPSSVTSIGDWAFSGCSGLTSVTIPSSVKNIGKAAFSSCSGLTSITVAKGNPVYHSANNCLIETESKTLIAGCQNSVIPNDGSVTSIGDWAFYKCSGLTSVTIPQSVTSIESGAFSHCSGLTSVTIPKGVTSIGDWAFYGCRGLTSATIPSSVTSIGNCAFYGCSGLTSVTISQSVTSIGNRAFCGCKRLTVITIPAGVKTIGEEAFARCANLKTVCCAAPAKPSGWSERWLGDCKAEVVWAKDKPSAENAKLTPSPGRSASVSSHDYFTFDKLPLWIPIVVGIVLALGLTAALLFIRDWTVRQWFVGLLGGGIIVCVFLVIVISSNEDVRDASGIFVFVSIILQLINTVLYCLFWQNDRIIFGCVSGWITVSGIIFGIANTVSTRCKDDFYVWCFIEAFATVVSTVLLLVFLR